MTKEFCTIVGADNTHSLISAPSREGKSALQGTPLETATEQIARERVRDEQADAVQAERLAGVLERFWQLTPPGHADIDCLRRQLTAAEITGDPTDAQVKAFFMMLPADVIGSAISWGFSDTEVRERMYEFVDQYRNEIAEQLNGASAE